MRPRSSAIVLLGWLCGCSVAEVWMGQRCPTEEPACAPSDAAIVLVDAGRRDGAVACSCADASVDDGCLACAPNDTDTSLRCLPGEYRGTFAMAYRSGPAGVCGVIAAIQPSTASGAWSFALRGRRSADGTALVFDTSCLRAGDADGGSMTPPISAALNGRVDCTTGKLTASLRGTYSAVSYCDLGTVRQNYFFEGAITGTYDPTTKSFVGGQVHWQEPPVLIPPQPGGDGGWQATLVTDAGIDLELTGDCLDGVTFPDDAFPDAGGP